MIQIIDTCNDTSVDKRTAWYKFVDLALQPTNAAMFCRNYIQQITTYGLLAKHALTIATTRTQEMLHALHLLQSKQLRVDDLNCSDLDAMIQEQGEEVVTLQLTSKNLLNGKLSLSFWLTALKYEKMFVMLLLCGYTFRTTADLMSVLTQLDTMCLASNTKVKYVSYLCALHHESVYNAFCLLQVTLTNDCWSRLRKEYESHKQCVKDVMVSKNCHGPHYLVQAFLGL